MNRAEVRFILKSFLIWRVFLFVILFLCLQIVPLRMDFLGGELSNYLKAPYLWAWANFDGEHYISLILQGYKPLTYFYFPLFPLSVILLKNLLNLSYIGTVFFGLILNNTLFFLGLIGLYKLVLIDYEKEVARYTILLLLLFPTSFYFASFYTESIFFALIVWSFYFLRKEKWILTGIFAGLSTAGRLVGVALMPVILVEIFLEMRKKTLDLKKALISLFIAPLGLIFYSLYLYIKTGDPLEFYHSITIFGEQRQSTLILLPQVFYRYIFKILPNINYDYFPVVFYTYLEFLTAAIFAVIILIIFFKMRFSYWVYSLIAFIIPTLSGSFSSLPRYVLVVFPVFMFVAKYLVKKDNKYRLILFLAMLTLLSVATSLFSRGYWIS